MVHLLVSEEFFSDKVGGAVRACGQEPVPPEWGEVKAVFDAIVAVKGAVGVVADLEDVSIDMIPLLARLKKSAKTKKLPMLGFCGDVEGEAAQAAEKLGVRVVARSALARDLVQIVMDLGASGE